MAGMSTRSVPIIQSILILAIAFVAKKLCPDLIILPMHFDRYGEMSRQVMAVFRRYDPNMSVVGCDEGYLKYVKMT